MLKTEDVAVTDLKLMIGRDLGVSEWIEIDQGMIDAFAKTTRDLQWIHVEPQRARDESPYGAPIAHGFLILSLLPAMTTEFQIRPAGVEVIINYGLDKLRFLSPVKAGARVRLHGKLLSVTEKGEGQHLMKTLNTMEIEGQEKPAFVAETLMLLVENKA